MKNPRFHNFEGRFREKQRLIPIIKRVVGPVLNQIFPNWLEFLDSNCSLRVPYHNWVHTAYGLIWLVKENAPINAVLAYLGHDAKHNGNKDQSPENISADTLQKALGHDNLRNLIMQTVFPYVSNINGAPYEWSQKPAKNLDEAWIRLADTYRPFVGLNPGLGVLETTPADIFGFECLGLDHELYEANGNTTFAQWIINGQANFFPDQINLGMNAGVFGSIIDSVDALARVEYIRSWLKDIIANENKFVALHELHRFAQQDITLIEFVNKRTELGL